MDTGVEDRDTRLTADEARQGVTGHKVRYVLFWSLGLAVVCLLAIIVAAHFGLI